MTFEQYAAERVPVLLRTAVALCGDVGLAEDLVQDVLIKVHRHWSRIEQVDARDAYVRRMLVNELVSWRRKWARVVPFSDVRNTIDPTDRADPADAQADRALLRAEIQRLPRRRQVVLALRYYGGLSDAEIADVLGCRVGTVRGHASRALAALRVDPALREAYLATPTQLREDC